MSDSLYERIVAASTPVNEQFATADDDTLGSFRASFVVPKTHPRSSMIEYYTYQVGPCDQAISGRRKFVLGDASLQSCPWIAPTFENTADAICITPTESETKERGWLDRFIVEKQLKEKGLEEIIAVGGGIIINAASYMAEQIGCDLVYVPTTVLAMADAAIGGKVRANVIENGVYHKHAYKRFYEPNRVVVDPRFLETLPDRQVTVGMGEIVKYGVYQSPALLEYLADDAFDPFRDKQALLKSILWAADLASVCYRIDPEETRDGGGRIIRGAHDASDKIEEASKFTIPHGVAVAMAIREELAASGHQARERFEICFKKFRFQPDSAA